VSAIFTAGQSTLGYPTLGEIINASKNNDVLGISDRASIIKYIQRAITLAAWKANYNPYLGDMDICADSYGLVTLPSEVGVILACNVGGFPALFRNNWFQYHINGPGSPRGCGPVCGYTWEEQNLSPVFQDIRQWSYVAALVEDATDGNGSLSLQVFGETMDASYNQKQAITIPGSGASSPGVVVPLLAGFAATDPAATQFRRITRVIKPVTRGYVKLVAFPGTNLAQGVTIGYYAPNETAPAYRRIRVGVRCEWVRIKYRRSEIKFVYDSDIIPLACEHALLMLIKAVRLYDTNNPDLGDKYTKLAVDLLLERELIENGPGVFQMQVDPGFGIGCVDFR
jgi:hypothetical protein